jgi:hypothetical protein
VVCYTLTKASDCAAVYDRGSVRVVWCGVVTGVVAGFGCRYGVVIGVVASASAPQDARTLEEQLLTLASYPPPPSLPSPLPQLQAMATALSEPLGKLEP